METCIFRQSWLVETRSHTVFVFRAAEMGWEIIISTFAHIFQAMDCFKEKTANQQYPAIFIPIF